MREFRFPHVSLTRVRKADQSNITQGNIWKKMKADGKSKRKKACESGMQKAVGQKEWVRREMSDFLQ